MIRSSRDDLEKEFDASKTYKEKKMSKGTRNRSWREVGVAISTIIVLGIGALLVANPAFARNRRGSGTDCGEECYHECQYDGGCVSYYAQGNSVTFICEDGDITIQMTGSLCAD